jgi:hypothetical protein
MRILGAQKHTDSDPQHFSSLSNEKFLFTVFNLVNNPLTFPFPKPKKGKRSFCENFLILVISSLLRKVLPFYVNAKKNARLSGQKPRKRNAYEYSSATNMSAHSFRH